MSKGFYAAENLYKANEKSDIRSVNINDFVKVVLTEQGEKVHRNCMSRLLNLKDSMDDKCAPDKDSDGYTKYQLWILMNTFGPYCFNGAEPMFIDNKVVLCDEED